MNKMHIASILKSGIKKFGGIIIITLFLSSIVYSSAPPKVSVGKDILFFPINRYPPEEWNKTYGGYGCCTSVFQTNDNGYVITGYYYSDVFLLKLDEWGNDIWLRTFGGKGLDWGMYVQQTSDNCFIVIGLTRSFGSGETDVWLLKTDEDGQELWNCTFGGEKLDEGHSGMETDDGGYIILGVTQSFVPEKNDYWVIKTDKDGIETWNYTYGGIGWDLGMSIQQTHDNGYIMTGATDVSPDGSHQIDLGLIKIDSEGMLVWEKTFGTQRFQDQGLSVKQTSDGGYVLTGVIKAFQDSWKGGDAWLIKTDPQGNKEWDKIFGGFESDVAVSVIETSDQGYVVLGKTDSFGAGKYDLFLMKLDNEGDELWDITFGGNRNEECMGSNSVQQILHEGYIIVGATESFGDSKIGHGPWVIKVAEPTLMVQLSGGFGLSATIENHGSIDLSHVNWCVNISGPLVFKTNFEGVIELLPAQSIANIDSIPIFGFGPVVIRLTSGGIGKVAKGFVLGSFIILH